MSSNPLIPGNTRTVLQTPSRGHLDGDQVRGACTAANTTKAYRSYVKGISKWIRATRDNTEEFFCEDGSLNLSVLLPEHFEFFLLHKRNAGNVKVSTLSGYRSALKDVYRQKRVDVPAEYLDDMKTFFRGLKRVEAEEDQAGGSRGVGKEPLTFSLFVELAKRTLTLSDNGFAHLFLLTQRNLMCRSKSVETLHISHLRCADDSVSCILHKTKTNQEGSGPKEPRHVYANPFQPVCCWMLALGVYLVSNPTLVPGKLFPGSNQKSRFCKIIGKMLEEITGEKEYGTHSIRKGVATYASSGSTGGPSIVSVCLRCGWSLGGVQGKYFRYEAAGDQYLGRVVARLSQNSSQFSVLPPHFEDPQNDFIRECTIQLFPALETDAHTAPVLQLGLASVLKHAEFLRQNLPSKHAMLTSYIFRNPDIMARLNNMLSTGKTTWICPTGIPPNVELFQQHVETREAWHHLPDVLLDGVAKLLEERGVGQQSVMRENLTSTIRTLMCEAGL